MYRKAITILLAAYFVGFLNKSAAQAQIIFNGAYMNISAGAQLVVDNGAANAITRVGGHIISEGQQNNVKWITGNSTGTYVVPFGYGTNYLPLSFAKTEGTGSGHYIFSTYHTGWQNSLQLPDGVSNLEGSATDNSMFVLDRFWQLKATGYITKPVLTNLTFTYPDAEHTNPKNSISEAFLQAQKWNTSTQKWIDADAGGTANTEANTVKVVSLTPQAQDDWWLLVAKPSALPVKLLWFTATARGLDAALTWATDFEVQSRGFLVQRSKDAIMFETIDTVLSTGSNRVGAHYNFIDKSAFSGSSYYRLKQLDWDGDFTYSEVKKVVIANSDTFNFSVYPNPVKTQRFILEMNASTYTPLNLRLINAEGKVVLTQSIEAGVNKRAIGLPKSILPGIYTLQLLGRELSASQRIIVY